MSEFVPIGKLKEQRKALTTELDRRKRFKGKVEDRTQSNVAKVTAATETGKVDETLQLLKEGVKLGGIHAKVERGIAGIEKKLAPVEKDLAADARVDTYTQELAQREGLLARLQNLARTQDSLGSLLTAHSDALEDFKTLPKRDEDLQGGFARRQAPQLLEARRNDLRDNIREIYVATAAADTSDQLSYVLPDGTEIEGIVAQLLHLLPVSANNRQSEEIKTIGGEQISEALYPGIDKGITSNRLATLISRTRQMLKETGIEIVNVVPLGSSKRRGEYYMQIPQDEVSPITPEGFRLGDRIVAGVEGELLGKLYPFSPEHIVERSQLVPLVADQKGKPEKNLDISLLKVHKLLEAQGLRLKTLSKPDKTADQGLYIEPIREAATQITLLGEVIKVKGQQVRLPEQQRRLLYQLGTQQQVPQERLDSYLLRTPDAPEVHLSEELSKLGNILSQVTQEENVITKVGNAEFGVLYKVSGISVIAKEKDKYLPLHPVHVEAVNLYLAGGTREILALFEPLGMDNPKLISETLAAALSRLTNRNEAGILTPEETALHEQLPQSYFQAKGDFFKRLTKDLIGSDDELEKPETIELPEGIILTNREEQFWGLLRDSWVGKVVTEKELSKFLSDTISDKQSSINKTILSLRKKLESTGIEILSHVDELSGRKRTGYILKRISPIVVVPEQGRKEEKIILPEFPAEFGPLSTIDIGVLAAAVLMHRRFLSEVNKAGGVATFEEEFLTTLSENYLQLPQDLKTSSKVITVLRKRAFDKAKVLITAANLTDTLTKVEGKDPHVAALLRHLAEIQKIGIEIQRRNENPMWVEGIDGVRAITTEPDILRSGVRVRDAQGNLVASIAIKTTGGEQRHMHLDKVVVTPVKDPLDHLVALMRGEEVDESLPTYSLKGWGGEELRFKGRMAELVGILDRLPEGELIQRESLQTTLGIGSTTLHGLLKALETDLENTGYSLQRQRGSSGGYSLIKLVVETKQSPVSSPVVAGDMQEGVAIEVRKPSRERQSQAKHKILTSELKETALAFLRDIERHTALQYGAKEEALRKLFPDQLENVDFRQLQLQGLITKTSRRNQRYTPEDIATVLCLVKYGEKLKSQQKTDLPRLIKQVQEERNS